MRHEHFQISRISTLIFCCCELLTSSYPFQVAIHVLPLIALAKRVLMVDGSSSPSIALMNSMKQEFFVQNSQSCIHTYWIFLHQLLKACAGHQEEIAVLIARRSRHRH